MKKFVVFLSAVALLGFALQQEGGVKFEKEGTPFQEILNLSKKTGKPIMVDFYTDWCGWCKVLDDSTYQNPRVGEFSRNFINFKVNAEKGEGIELAKRFRIRGYPTILFLDSTGKEIDRIIGFRPPEPFLERLKEILAGVNTFGDIHRRYQADSNDVEIAYKWAKKLEDRELIEEARIVYERVLKLDPGNERGYAPNVHWSLGDIARRKGDLQSYRQHLQTIIQNYPGYQNIHWAYMNLATSYFGERNYKRGVEILEQAPDSVVAKQPGQFRYFQAYAYMELGDYEKAFQTLDSIKTEEFPESALDDLRTRIYLKKGDTEKALPLLRKRYEWAKGSAERLNNLAWMCVEYKVNVDEALKWAQEAVELSKWEKGYIIDTLAELYALKGDYQKAIELEQKALQKTQRERWKKEFQEKIEKWKALLEKKE